MPIVPTLQLLWNAYQDPIGTALSVYGQITSLSQQVEQVERQINDLMQPLRQSVTQFVASTMADVGIQTWFAAKKAAEEAATAVFPAISIGLSSFLAGLGWAMRLLASGPTIMFSYAIGYLLDRGLEYARAIVWSAARYVMEKLKADIRIHQWLDHAARHQIGALFTLVEWAFPTTFPLMGKLEFLRHGSYNPYVEWTYAGYNILEITTIAKRWKCYPVYVTIKKLKEEWKERAGQAAEEVKKDADRALPVIVYGDIKGIKKAAYDVGYMLERLLHEDDILHPEPGDATAPANGLIVHAFGCPVIAYPEPPVRVLIKVKTPVRILFDFYKDDRQRYWLRFDGYGTFTTDPSLLEHDNVVLLKGRTWIDDGVKGVLKLAFGDDRYIPFRVRARAKRLFSDIMRLLYPVLWTKDLREHGLRVTQVPATSIHIDAIERHLRFFEGVA